MNKNEVLMEYIQQSLHTQKKAINDEPGPLVTVSREYGCPGIPFTEALTAKLQKDAVNDWKLIDREIVNQASEALDLNPDEIERIIKEKNPGVFKELMTSFTTHYVPSDITIKKKYAAIVSSIAETGKVVLLGRGSEVLTNNIKQSLHIRIIGRKEYRLPRVCEMNNVDSKKGALIMENVDRERVYLRDFFSGEETNNYYYDVIFNAERNSIDSMVQAVFEMMKSRELI